MPKEVEILRSKDVYARSFVRVEEVTLRHERYDGEMSEELVRVNIDRGDSVAALIHDTERDEVILVEQFRYSTHASGGGWIVEVPAGILEAGEDPAEAIQREIMEEAGYDAPPTDRIGVFYPSPGMCSERIHLYYVPVTKAQKRSDGGGLDSEGEDIRSLVMPTKRAIGMLEKGRLSDGKTILALLWLQTKT